ncbi:MAG TPA: MBL fold metallo-hydrolase [Kineosporiaceae bacterium]|nr:MBL fold metallo-hydrolase [Kineosporiaceae bacterium]
MTSQHRPDWNPSALPPWRGGAVEGAAAGVALCVLADNPGPMTLDGTNTWLLARPGAAGAVVVDPGPDDEPHLRRVLAAAERRGVRVVQVLLTHGHLDHSAGARRMAELTSAPVRALDPAHTLGAEGLSAGEVLEVDGLRLDVLGTPGHTADSLCFALPDQRAVLTGDTVLGRGTTVVAHPDGRLEQYLTSLQRLERLAAEHDLEQVLPGHGPVLAVPDATPVDVVRFYLRHRQARLDQVRAAVAAGARTAWDVVERVYADVDRRLWPAAELSVRAQLDYLGVTPTA